jgi:hypothetical protein
VMATAVRWPTPSSMMPCYHFQKVLS